MKEIIRKWNSLGINLPLARDPKTGTGSYTASLVVISSICVIASLVMPFIDKTQSLSFFIASASLYLGRKWTDKSIDNTIKD